ncbi:ctenidin-1-like [Schistocerca nitens]|uniref:ctenidin-1-like n=1 Tax=Schistocerca nitens TaxID=7011 RepID=UPI002117EC9F|nr:ctenidin-1-like [Schistocerca nitens]
MGPLAVENPTEAVNNDMTSSSIAAKHVILPLLLCLAAWATAQFSGGYDRPGFGGGGFGRPGYGGYPGNYWRYPGNYYSGGYRPDFGPGGGFPPGYGYGGGYNGFGGGGFGR